MYFNYYNFIFQFYLSKVEKNEIKEYLPPEKKPPV